MSDKKMGREMQNVKEKMRKVKVGGLPCILGTPVVRKFRKYPVSIYIERFQRGSGIRVGEKITVRIGEPECQA